MRETDRGDQGPAAEHPDGTASFTPTAPTPHAASIDNSNTSALEKETQVASLTGNDKVIGPNAPVGELRSRASSSNVASETTLAGDEKIGASGGAMGDGAIIDKAENEVNEKEGTAESEEEAEDESKYPGGVALTLLTLGLCLSCFVVALDNTIIGKQSRKVPFLRSR
ncbi:MAG: hypothetical protein Q9187_008126 [Circinaria calcarea]